ncbi:Bombyxin B-1 homolog [Eumeta japonica]|uniref:Bombyxin B-1 homolog n=1 Tax=Eumeta variegata TaxID=151549 RepID=A0A4C1Z5E6_EUMVA|nr:Bombyxin B-1 homolog [Eumeta japonica]
MKLATVLFLACAALAARAQMEGKMTLCGRRLSAARELLCYGQDQMQKRDNAQKDLYASESEQSWAPAWPWGGRRAALSARWARHKRGLVDECCLKSCTVDEILSYC